MESSDGLVFKSLQWELDNYNEQYKVPTIAEANNLQTSLLMEHPVAMKKSVIYSKKDDTCCTIN